jgi:4-hydroxyacetophenone monooxygenase
MMAAMATGTELGTGQLDDILADADLRALVMCLYHHTGDEVWLSDRYAPERDVKLVADCDAGFGPDVQAEIRAAARKLLVDMPEPVVTNPDPEEFRRLMGFCLGEEVPEEYVPMMMADLGFDPVRVPWPDDARLAPADVDTLIIGAGASGMGLATRLDELGVDYTMVEKNAEVGGTWFENRYPGCGVDTPNHFYSYSFAPNPSWNYYFSPRDELQAYLARCADDFGVRDRIRFGTEVVAARWDEKTARWRVTVRPSHPGPDGRPSRDPGGGDAEWTPTDGAQTEELTARILVSATGHFNQPMAAGFAGDTTFGGRIVHTARWPDDLDVTGKRVAVIGTGASSVQLVPTIAEQGAHITVFQRTPQWVRPTEDYNSPVPPGSRWLFENLPYYGRWYRFAQFWRYGDGLLRFLKRDPDWPHPERAMNRINDRHRQEMEDHIRSELAACPELIEQCTPHYPPFGKRILLDNDWYKTLCRADVDLVTEPIAGFEPAGVRAGGDLHEVDVIVLATGFTVTTLAARLDITGRNGVTLAADWVDENPTAYLGMTVPGFPNLFVMYGPNTNLGHGGSGIWVGETQACYIANCLAMMARHGWLAMEVKAERRDTYTEQIDAAHAELIWTHPGTTTYYRNANGQVRSPMPFRMVDYWHLTRHPDPDDFVGCGATEIPS